MKLFCMKSDSIEKESPRLLDLRCERVVQQPCGVGVEPCLDPAQDCKDVLNTKRMIVRSKLSLAHS